MACRVYRHTRFGDFREESISTVHWITPPEVGKPNPARFLHDGAAAAMTTSSSTVLDSVTTPEDGEKLRDDPQKTGFSLDTSNPLNVSVACKNSNHTDPTSQPQPDNANHGEARPLNTASLMKRRNQVHQTSIRRPFFQPGDKAIARPGTADPRSTGLQGQARSNSLNIVAPVPRQAPRPSSPSLSSSLASGVFATNAPQSVLIPSLPKTTPNENQLKNDAHTASSTLSFSFSNPYSSTETFKTQQLPSPPDSLRARSGVRDFLAADTDTVPPPFTLDLSGPNQTGPQRVLLNPDGTRGPLVDQNDDIRLTLNRTNSSLLKRPRPDKDVDSENQDESNECKRHRQEDVFQHAHSVVSQLSSPGNVSARLRNHSRTPDHETHYEHRNHPHSPSDNSYRVQSFYHEPVGRHTVVDVPSGLDKLLGYGVNVYAEEHLEQYGRAIERWKECTMEEWIAGANEQAARFSKILDFVKEHMTSKMKLFASFDDKVDRHNNVLSEREKALEAVKGRLVKESAHVLGHGC
ncbi:hypothetical protein H0H87_011289 [Tephrocybe sp. NHM501043]|nr:hypothetical protein H0H87_011289 [Tephrocybe sp. NHM501043]